MEERIGLEKLNREIEQEKTALHQAKMQRTHERVNDYNQMKINEQTNQPQGNEFNMKKKKTFDDEWFKIGGERHLLKRKTYEEATNNLAINPTRENIQRSRGDMQQNMNQRVQNRGKSQGYNIINHSNDHNMNTNIRPINYETNPLNDLNQLKLNQQEKKENLENYINDREYENYGKQEDQEDPEFIKYYQEYLRNQELLKNQQNNQDYHQQEMLNLNKDEHILEKREQIQEKQKL